MRYLFSYKEFAKKNSSVQMHSDGISFIIDKDWIIEGEDRLSYASILCLVEFCREYHWEKDFLSQNKKLDSITQNIYVSFFKPLVSGSKAFIKYNIKSLNMHMYKIIFEIFTNEIVLCKIEMECVFYNESLGRAVRLEEDVYRTLKKTIFYE